jgi:hypothetical protein
MTGGGKSGMIDAAKVYFVLADPATMPARRLAHGD